MKKLLISALIAGCVLLTSGLANAQTKLAHVNFEALVTADPSFAGIQKSLEAYSQEFVTNQKAIQGELQKLGEDYDKNRATMTDAQRTKAEGELQAANTRLTNFNQDAQNKVNQKQAELFKPLIDKYRAAVAQVAKEKGYTYVINTASTELLVAPDTDDLAAAVKAKVGAGGTAPATTTAKPNGPVKK